jgi:hypothetical protein
MNRSVDGRLTRKPRGRDAQAAPQNQSLSARFFAVDFVVRFPDAFAWFSPTRNFTMRVTRSSGSGSSMLEG